MRLAKYALVLALALPLGNVTKAQDLAVGLDAAEEGDYSTALQVFSLLAEDGDAEAQFYLGMLYAEGMGLAQDWPEARRLWMRAAVQGHARAQHALGYIYSEGFGVPQDYLAAHMWLNIAAANGDDEARDEREALASEHLTPEQVITAQARARLCMSSGYQDCD